MVRARASEKLSLGTEPSRHDAKQSTSRHDGKQPTSRHDDKQPTSRHDDKQSTSRHDVKQSTSRQDDKQPTSRHDDKQPSSTQGKRERLRQGTRETPICRSDTSMSPEMHSRMDRSHARRTEGTPIEISGRQKLGWSKWGRMRERSVSPIRKGTSADEQAHELVGELPSSPTPPAPPRRGGFASPIGVDPTAPNPLLIAAAARNENRLLQANTDDRGTLGEQRQYLPADPE
jgi:hypothetical protein